jgi:hypothetical protein
MQDISELRRALGLIRDLGPRELESHRRWLRQYINLQLIANGLPAPAGRDEFAEVARGLLDQPDGAR